MKAQDNCLVHVHGANLIENEGRRGRDKLYLENRKGISCIESRGKSCERWSSGCNGTQGLPGSYRTFGTVVSQREKAMSFSEFKRAPRNFEEIEKSCQKAPAQAEDNVMVQKTATKGFSGNCYHCGRKGHKE